MRGLATPEDARRAAHGVVDAKHYPVRPFATRRDLAHTSPTKIKGEPDRASGEKTRVRLPRTLPEHLHLRHGRPQPESRDLTAPPTAGVNARVLIAQIRHAYHLRQHARKKRAVAVWHSACRNSL